MPVREKVEHRIVQLLGRGNWTWSNGMDTATSNEGHKVSYETYGEFERFASDLWEHLLDEIDWSRVQIEASCRHISLDHPPVFMSDDVEAPCGECIHQALLSRDRSVVNWPEVVQPDDWREIRSARRRRLEKALDVVRAALSPGFRGTLRDMTKEEEAVDEAWYAWIPPDELG